MVALNDRPPKSNGRCVIYWAQNALRGAENEALNAAIALADELNVGVVAYLALHANLPHATARGYAFLIDGLRDMEAALESRRVPLVIRTERPMDGVVSLVKEARAAAVITDRSALRFGRRLRAEVAGRLEIACFEVDSEHVVPLHVVGRLQNTARSLRTIIERNLDVWLWERHDPEPPLRHEGLEGLERSNLGIQLLETLEVDNSVPSVSGLVGGAHEADRKLSAFLHGSARESTDWLRGHSGLSPYIRFGQISPAAIVRKLRSKQSEEAHRTLEEVLTRRELSANFTWYTPRYWTISALPSWARETLKEHAGERRSRRYTRDELINAQTDDELWNAAQLELLHTGRIQSYVRMYWGKRLVEWFADPARGLSTAIWLNDRYALDGRSSNGVANIQWCFGLHDRPFPERPKFGVVRPLGTGGVRRHLDMDGYVRWANSLCAGRPD